MAKKRKAKGSKSPRVNRWARQTEWRSGFEKSIREDLTKRKVPFEYEPTAFPIRVLGSSGHVCGECGSRKVERTTRYTPDFYLQKQDLYIEAKGKLDPRAKKAILAFKNQYPTHRLHVLFQRDNWTTKTKTEKYTDWCTRHGIVSAVGTEVPDGWL